MLFAWVALHESLNATQLVGGVLVLTGIVLVKLDDEPGGDEEPVSGTPGTTVVLGD